MQAKRPRTKAEQNSIKAAVGDTPLSLNQLSVLNERHGVKPLSLVGGCYPLRATIGIKRSSLNARMLANRIAAWTCLWLR